MSGKAAIDGVSTTSGAATRRVAAALARALTPPCVVLLHGDLGAGKTTFAQGFVHALSGGAELRVQSPTYALARTYETTPPVHHLDLYRLDDESVAHDLGLLEMLSDADAFALVEWPERAPSLREHPCVITLHITGSSARGRRLSFPDLEGQFPGVLATLRAAAKARTI